MGLSIRAYARHRGVSHVAVKKAIDSGRITPEADGSIDPVRADHDWAQNTLSPRSGVSSRTRAAPAAAQATVHEPPHRTAHDPSEPSSPPLASGGTSLLQARTVNEVVKVQTNKLRLAQMKGELVDRAHAIAHVYRLARSERDAWLNWPARVAAEMAAKLGVDAHALHVTLEAAVRDHLSELGELQPRID